MNAPSGSNFITPKFYEDGAEAKERLAITETFVDTRITIDATGEPWANGPFTEVRRKFDPLLGRDLEGKGLELELLGAVPIKILAVDEITSSAGME